MENFARGVSTKLCCAIEEGNLSEVKKNLSEEANALTRNDYHTVLHSAVRSDNEEVVKLILDKIEQTQGTVRPYIDDTDTDGETLLMWTAKCNFLNVARILLEYGATIEAKNTTGMTALHWAAKNNNIQMMKLLISKGANINIKDLNGLKPLDFAREERRGEIYGYIAFIESEMFRKQGKYNDAWQAYQEALNKQEVALGSFHPDVLTTRHNMAVVLANQGKHSEALEIYQDVFDIQKRSDVLGPDHPDTLMTRYNMAVSFTALDDSKEVFSIFREFVNTRGAQSHSNHPIHLIKSDFKKIEKGKWCRKINLSQEGDNKLESYLDITVEKRQCEFVGNKVAKKVTESSMCSRSEENQEKQESNEEIFEPKLDKLKALKWSIKRHLEDRSHDVAKVTYRVKNRGRQAWHYFLVDSGAKEKFFELSEKRSMNILGIEDEIDELYSKKLKDDGKTLFFGFCENPPQNFIDKIDEFFNKKVSNDLFVIKEECENLSIYHYVLIDPDKKKMFLEQSNTNVSLLKKVEKCGIVLYSGLGQDPNEIISDKILETYFCGNNGIVKDIFAKLGFSSAGQSNWTPLHDASYIGNLQVVKNLTEDGANCHVKDAVCGRKPVHIAAREGHKDIVEFFLNRGINVNEADEKRWTILHYAAWSGHLKTVKLLIDKGSDIHAKEGTRGKKPIHIAAERGYMNIVNFFLKNSLSVDDTDKEGRTSLYYAAVEGHLEVLKNLADKGANINAEVIHGTKPIHVAARSGSKNVVEFLLDRGANVNDTNKYNDTPLHFAAQDGNLGVVQFLIKKGANIDARNIFDKTPSEIARGRDHNDIVNLFDDLKGERKRPIYPSQNDIVKQGGKNV